MLRKPDNCLFYILSPFILVSTTTAGSLAVGDGQIDGRKLQPYALTWRQCTFADGHWSSVGDLTEKLDVIGPSVLRQRQTGHPGAGAIQRTDVFLDRQSFSPLRIETEVTKDGMRHTYAVRQLDADGYSGFVEQNGERKDIRGRINTGMLHGGGMGLPLATLPFQDEPLEFAASMISFDGTYRVIASWIGRETTVLNGTKTETWLIDVEWHHHESGDVYPPGPDASGGRYWVVPEPPPGTPYVLRYKTDTYAVEFVREVCP